MSDDRYLLDYIKNNHHRFHLFFVLVISTVFSFSVLYLSLISSLPSHAQTGLPIVPGGEGYGMDTRAAYACGSNPTIYRVNTILDDNTLILNADGSYSGSLRSALEASGPRAVIFEISGTIELGSDISIKQSCVTLAGQTAPSPGITLKNWGIIVYAQNVLIQHIRIRPGDGGPVWPQTAGHDATLNYGVSGFTPHDIVYDHVSFSWAGGKNANIITYGNPANVTYWRCIDSEALYYAKNVIISPSQPSSLGMLVGGQNIGVSIIGNLFAHNSDRNPEIHENTSTQFINNVVYDWGKDTTWYAPATFFYQAASGPWKASIVGNKYIAGPPPHPFTPLYAIYLWNSVSQGSQLYMNDNAVDQTLEAVTPYMSQAGFDPIVSTPPVPLTGITVRPSSTVESFVLSNAGARPLDRDAVDVRIVNEVTQRTGNVISSQDQVGGWPVLAENHRNLSPPPNPHGDDNGNGYTNLEEWLHGYAQALEPSGSVATSVPTASVLSGSNYIYINNSQPMPANFRPYLPSSPWNLRLPDNPQNVDAISSQRVQEYARNTNSMWFGTDANDAFNNCPNCSSIMGYPVYIASTTDPQITIDCSYTVYGCSVDSLDTATEVSGYNRTFRIPANARSGCNTFEICGDRNMAIIQPDGSELELYGCNTDRDFVNGDIMGGDWNIPGIQRVCFLSGANLNNVVTGNGFNTSVTGGDNFSSLDALYNEVVPPGATINHALEFRVSCATDTVYPWGGIIPCEDGFPGIPAGSLIHLNLSHPQIDSLVSQGKISSYLRPFYYALHDYGAYIMDGGGESTSQHYFYGYGGPRMESSAPWLRNGGTNPWIPWFQAQGAIYGENSVSKFWYFQPDFWGPIENNLEVLSDCYAQGTCNDSINPTSNPTSATLSVLPTTAVAGSSVTVSWNNIPNPTISDWISLSPQSSPDSQFIDWEYISCWRIPIPSFYTNPSGSCSFTIPSNAQPGNYEFKLFSNNGYTLIAKSQIINVTSTISQTPTPTQTQTSSPTPTSTPFTSTYPSSSPTGPAPQAYIPPGIDLNINMLAPLAEDIGGFLLILGGIIAFIVVIASGIRYLMAGGNPQGAVSAKNMLKAGIIGALIIFGFGVIVSTIRIFSENPFGFFQ